MASTVVAVSLAMVLAIPGCGGDDKSSSTAGTTSSTTSSTSTAPPPAAPPGATRGVKALALRRGELPGFRAQGAVHTSTAAAEFAADEHVPPEQIQKEEARLVRAGFVAGAVEDLASTEGAQGLSVVAKFRSPKSARAEVAFVAKPTPGTRQTDFAVPSIPGARGFDALGAQGSGHNVAFAVGPYYYLVGVGWSTGVPHPSRAEVEAVAQRLYKRVQG